MEFLTDYHLWVSFLSLTLLEIVLGIDNVVFIALLVGHLPAKLQQKARVIGLTLALLMRILMLLGVAWIISLKEPLFTLWEISFSAKSLLMLAGGLFLIGKGTSSIHEEVTGEEKEAYASYTGGFLATILQIVVVDMIFSLDSVMTAVGLTENIPVIVGAMTIAMIVMIAASGYIADFITRFPTLKMLALSFIMMIGVFLVAEGMGFHVPKGYIYFAMAYSLTVEVLNMLARKRRRMRGRS
ncbi:MAG: TerC family protein [Hyphomicrobiales bacterium]|nr:TerC family protein [Hyphomicrobiales bacterium]